MNGESVKDVFLSSETFVRFLFLVVGFLSDSATPWTVAYQAPLSMGFSRQEYWSGLSFPSPGNRPDPGIRRASPALQAESLPLSLLGSLRFLSGPCSMLGLEQRTSQRRRKPT